MAATPIIVGVADVKNRSTKADDAIEPMRLMLDAIQNAVVDASSPKLGDSIDSISVVKTWTWPYTDLPGLLAQKLGVEGKLRYKEYSEHGGNQPGKLIDEAARRISKGEAKVAVVTGGEALASLTACSKAQSLPPPGWTTPSSSVQSIRHPGSWTLNDIPSLSQRDFPDLGAIHNIGAPIHVYPLYENAFRAHRRQTIQANNAESARLYAEFARVAKKQPYAWSFGKPAETEKSIGTVSKRNRMICFPYPLLMNAFNTVNLAAACILISTELARELGIPESKWIYPLGGAGTRDSYEFWERPNFYSSPSITRSLDAAIDVSGLQKEQIDLFDFYSCFPIVPKLAAHHLDLPITKRDKPLTLLGGLTSFGGAGNNYSLHAFTEMVRQLRAGNGKTGLILANGGVVTYQHVVCLSSSPRSGDSSYPAENPLPAVITDVPVPTVDFRADEGEAVVETYTVEFKRDNSPLRGYVVGRMKDTGQRFLANHGDESTLRQLASDSKEPIGRSGWVLRDTENPKRNLFSFEKEASL